MDAVIVCAFELTSALALASQAIVSVTFMRATSVWRLE
jgi:hypothetical protein